MRVALLPVALFFAFSAAATAQVTLPLVPERPPESEPTPEAEPPAPGEPAQPRDREARRAPARNRRRLSDERTESRWAYVTSATWARARPNRRARRIRLLSLRTPDRTREVVPALEQRRVPGRGTWVRVRLPMLPNNTTGWVRRGSLGRFHVVRTFLRVDRRRLRATLFRDGRRIWAAPIGVGEAQWPTPRGRFYVRERLLPTDPDGLYGVFAFGLSAYSETLTDWPGGGMIGIHGTNEPGILPGRVSHGCVRLSNRRIARLRGLMPLGTPVEIR